MEWLTGTSLSWYCGIVYHLRFQQQVSSMAVARVTPPVRIVSGQ